MRRNKFIRNISIKLKRPLERSRLLISPDALIRTHHQNQKLRDHLLFKHGCHIQTISLSYSLLFKRNPHPDLFSLNPAHQEHNSHENKEQGAQESQQGNELGAVKPFHRPL